MATKPDLLEQIVQTNLMGTIWSCQLMVKSMMRRKSGMFTSTLQDYDANVYYKGVLLMSRRCWEQKAAEEAQYMLRQKQVSLACHYSSYFIITLIADYSRPYTLFGGRSWTLGYSDQYHSPRIY
jgi:NAD(P)-dependent dehydrogenase (short-subunit alcohol dehydrogenase family)